jgi:hypothetical protein
MVCTQPLRILTRARRIPCAEKTCGRSIGLAGDKLFFGVMSSMARSDPENIHLNGRPSFPARSPRRKRRELGISAVRVRLITRRKRGLRYVASTCSSP